MGGSKVGAKRRLHVGSTITVHEQMAAVEIEPAIDGPTPRDLGVETAEEDETKSAADSDLAIFYELAFEVGLAVMAAEITGDLVGAAYEGGAGEEGEARRRVILNLWARDPDGQFPPVREPPGDATRRKHRSIAPGIDEQLGSEHQVFADTARDLEGERSVEGAGLGVGKVAVRARQHFNPRMPTISKSPIEADDRGGGLERVGDRDVPGNAELEPAPIDADQPVELIRCTERFHVTQVQMERIQGAGSIVANVDTGTD